MTDAFPTSTPVKSGRRNLTPVLISDQDGGAVSLDRVPFSQREIREGWLQDLVFRNPTLLAVEEIEPDYGPLIPLGREVGTPSGPIDALFTSPDGLLTVVEAKLWRNPEARRVAVAQIIDYAKHLSGWTYEQLDQQVERARGEGIWSAVRAAVGDEALQEDEFVDAVSRNLRRGRFLLLLVGDGIRENVEAMAEFLQGTPQLRFTLALVELGLYRGPGGRELLVVPSVVARTREIVRAVVEVTDVAAVHGVRPAVSPPTGGSTPSQGGRSGRVTTDEFYATMLEKSGPRAVEWVRELEHAAERRDLQITMQTASMMVKLPDPGGSGKEFTLFGINQAGRFFIGWLGRQTVEAGYRFEGSPAERYIACMSDLFGKRPIAKDRPQPEFWDTAIQLAAPPVPVSDVLRCLDAFLSEIRAVEV